MKTLKIITINIAIYITSITIIGTWGHSAPSCIWFSDGNGTKIDGNGTKIDGNGTKIYGNGTVCLGYPRYYHFNHLPTPLPSSDLDRGILFYSSRDRQTIIQPGVEGTCPVMSIPEYTDQFPMTIAKRGETLQITHPPRGHASQPSSDVWIYIYPFRNAYPNVKQPNSSYFKLIGSYPFASKCNGIDREISWANCTGNVIIPRSIRPGVYTFLWRWNLNEIPYSDCFEVNVIQ